MLRGAKRYLGTEVKRKAPINPRLLLRQGASFRFFQSFACSHVGAFSSRLLLLFTQVEFSC